MLMHKKYKFLFVICLLIGTSAISQIKLAPVFTDNMILQRNTQASLWGWSGAGKTVTVTTSWNNKKYTVKADASGKWKVQVQTPEAGGLTSYGKELKLFEVAGKDKIFYPAKTVVQRSSVLVSSPQVREPVAVRYAFRDFVTGELYSTEGLPVSSFRTDNWDQ
jgi:hypothetical protein